MDPSSSHLRWQRRLIPWNPLGAALALCLLLLFYRCRSTSAQRSRAFPTRWDLHAPVARKRCARRALQRRLRGGPGDAVVIQRPGFVRDVCFLLAILLTSTATVWAAMSFLSLYAACVLLIWSSGRPTAAQPPRSASPRPFRRRSRGRSGLPWPRAIHETMTQR